MEKSFSQIMDFKSLFAEESTFNPINDIIAERERKVVGDTTIDQTLVPKKRNSAYGFYYLYDGTFLGNFDVSDEVVVCIESAFYKKSKTNPTAFYEFRKPIRLKMTNGELNLRAFMSTLKQAENHGNSPLPYNAWNGFIKGDVITFTSKSYEESPIDYAEHPGFPNGSSSSAAGAYQILKGSWNDPSWGEKIKKTYGITDFSPQGQDKFVVGTLKLKRKALEEIKLGNISTAFTMKEMRNEWSSLPGASQQGISLNDGLKLFKNNVSRELSRNSELAIVQGQLPMN